MVSIPAKAATFEAEGNTAYYKCTVCGKIFSDTAGTKEITPASTVIAKLKKVDISSANIDNIPNGIYTGSAQIPSLTVKIGTTVLKKGTDYDLAYSNNINAGTATVTITGKGNYTGTCSRSFIISPKTVTPEITLAKTSYVYNKKAQKPAVTVTADGKILVVDTDYTVSYEGNPTAVGEYIVTVTLKGNYSGTGIASFKIIPKGTAISKATAGTKTATVKWKKQTTQTTGYQIQYSLKKNFTGAKSVTVNKAKTVSKKLTKLKSGKTYYIRIRTYKKIGQAKYYSAWSAAKKVKVK